jgi:hypothetical protein
MTEIETLNLAAKGMREAHGPEHKRHDMWEAMAYLMERTALLMDGDRQGYEAFYVITVAQAYLDADPG